ncbi:MAG TPA: 16S rRNA (guanine(966)-N(2))-methyltransferase RsmD [Acidimicrobiales bacterium]|nr:16S rRNA (guanine(966)-N(2))-methyltransferase RsmD [Acidimicrobiales bacterium]
MRIVGGEASGRKLRAPTGRTTRPTSDQVREAIFNILYGLQDIEGADVVDLFAGSGALGIEALSRGAAHATFVESDHHALTAIRDNLESTGMADRATVVRSDVLRWVADAPAFAVAFVDPPYAFSAWDELLDHLTVELAVLESGRAFSLPGTWRAVRDKRYGTTVVTLARPRGADGGEQDRPDTGLV